MEHQAVEAALLILDQCEGRVFRDPFHRKPGRQRCDSVAVAHPDGVFFARVPNPVEERRSPSDIDQSTAEFAVVSTLNLSTELLGHGHLAVADAKDRNAS